MDIIPIPYNTDCPETRFQYSVGIVLEHEGGLSNDKRDPGGITKWGISLRYLRVIGLDINHDGSINSEDILAIDHQKATAIYREYWWDKYGYNQLKSIDVASKVFDLAVNMGANTAHKLLQISINRLQDTPIKVDGFLGSNTLLSANLFTGSVLRQELRECAEHHYLQIIADNPSLFCFKNGWLNRAAW